MVGAATIPKAGFGGAHGRKSQVIGFPKTRGQREQETNGRP